MAYFNSRGLRGNDFEQMINYTNDIYREKQLALIQKIPTSITPIELDNETRTISLAYFEKKSTVDYIGVVQGIPICFDAKETAQKNLPLKNIHEHQIKFMQDFQNQKGIAFLLVRFLFNKEIFFLPFNTLNEFWNNSKEDGRKSIPYNSFDKKLLIPKLSQNEYFVHYLEVINLVLKE